MNQVIKTKNYEIGSGNPAYIIAEIGSNHNGNYDLAFYLNTAVCFLAFLFVFILKIPDNKQS